MTSRELISFLRETAERSEALSVALEMARDENTALIAERDAAVKALGEYAAPCQWCKHYDEDADICENHRPCTMGEEWEWRGVNPGGCQ